MRGRPRWTGHALGRPHRLVKMAEKLFGSSEQARQWQNTPSRNFEGKSPLEYADNDIGTREVEAVLDRIGNGVIQT